MAITYDITVGYSSQSSSVVAIRLYYADMGVNNPVSPINPLLMAGWTLFDTITNPTLGVYPTITFTPPTDTPHRVFAVVAISECVNGSYDYGDVRYCYSPSSCPSVTYTANGSSIDVTWDSLCDDQGSSIKEYTIRYVESGTPNPVTTVTVPIQDLVTYWGANPGSYPSYTQNLSAGITSGNSYDVSFSFTITYNIIIDPGYITVEQTVTACPSFVGNVTIP